MTPLPPDPTLAIRARLKAATPGPWRAEEYAVVMSEKFPLGFTVRSFDPKSDADFIAHAPSDIAALLALVDEAREALADLLDVARGHAASTCQEYCVHSVDDPAGCPMNDPEFARARALLGGETSHE